jgi:hypothetical protein
LRRKTSKSLEVFSQRKISKQEPKSESPLGMIVRNDERESLGPHFAFPMSISNHIQSVCWQQNSRNRETPFVVISSMTTDSSACLLKAVSLDQFYRRSVLRVSCSSALRDLAADNTKAKENNCSVVKNQSELQQQTHATPDAVSDSEMVFFTNKTVGKVSTGQPKQRKSLANRNLPVDGPHTVRDQAIENKQSKTTANRNLAVDEPLTVRDRTMEKLRERDSRFFFPKVGSNLVNRRQKKNSRRYSFFLMVSYIECGLLVRISLHILYVDVV